MPEYTITVDIPEDEIAELQREHREHPEWNEPQQLRTPGAKAEARLRRALIEAATPPPVTSITLVCLAETYPIVARFEIVSHNEQRRLEINLAGQYVVLPFDDVIDAVTQLRDTAKEMQP